MPEEGAQLIAHAVVIPDGVRQQALHAIRTGLFGMFGDLPAIFPGDVTDDGLQVEPGVTARLGARKTGRQALMQVEQAQRPAANVAGGWPRWWWCGVVWYGSGASCFSRFGWITQTRGFGASRVSHVRANCTKFFLIWGKFPGKWLCLQVPL